MFGMNVVSTQMAREVRTEWRVERHPTKKRRKQWRVVKHEINRPCAYQSGNTIYAHPAVIEQMRLQSLNYINKG